jgi:hypothetical protein
MNADFLWLENIIEPIKNRTKKQQGTILQELFTTNKCFASTLSLLKTSRTDFLSLLMTTCIRMSQLEDGSSDSTMTLYPVFSEEERQIKTLKCYKFA